MKPQTAALFLSLFGSALAAPVSNNGQVENNYSFLNPAGSVSTSSLSDLPSGSSPSASASASPTPTGPKESESPSSNGEQAIPGLGTATSKVFGQGGPFDGTSPGQSKSGLHSVNDSPAKRDPQGMGMGGGSSPFGSMPMPGMKGGSGGKSSGGMPGMMSGGSGGSSGGMPSGGMPGMMSGGSGGSSGGMPSGGMPGMMSGGSSGGKPSPSMPMPGGKGGKGGAAPSDIASGAMAKAFGMGGSDSKDSAPTSTAQPTATQTPSGTASPSATASGSDGGALDSILGGL